MRLQLTVEAMRLDAVLSDAGFSRIRGCDLFRLARHPEAPALFDQLARAGIWCRSFPERPDQLRFGLPGDEAGFERLVEALGPALRQAL